MADAGLDAVGDGGAGLDGSGGGAFVAAGELVAGHGGGGDVGDGPVALVVCCLADVCPVSLSGRKN